MKIPREASTFNELRAFLLVHGVTFADIAREGKYKPGTVRAVASRYWGCDKLPIGIHSMEILNKIKNTVRQLQVQNTEPRQAAS